jgi:ubiquinone/menaquinone biosynthesis C-methylase UbiE
MYDVYGVEMSELAVAQARERVGDRIHLGTLETTPFNDESFDVILFSHCLEHLFSPSDALGRVRRLLKPEGRGSIIRRWWGGE